MVFTALTLAALCSCRYMAGFTYYGVTNLDGRLKNVDQAITQVRAYIHSLKDVSVPGVPEGCIYMLLSSKYIAVPSYKRLHVPWRLYLHVPEGFAGVHTRSSLAGETARANVMSCSDAVVKLTTLLLEVVFGQEDG
eukprot:TRINITY_DN4940_c0_g1_i1.p1 TRINITY_DN4940_c0_g1~~TRINITY_DN4940_c0_g1_i1.p1  ORF type:complete len:136 (+),score=2.71 TRINITY_DN4940_c0_g1_i1:2477-2884(+)